MVGKGTSATRGTIQALGSTAVLLALPSLISSRYGAALAAVPPTLPTPPPLASKPATAAQSRPAAATAAVRAPAPTAVRYPLTRQRRALLATIRYAEGTWANGSPDGYRTLYGGELVSSLERHPDIVVVNRYASAAAGAYQMLPATWEAASRRLGLRGFGPANQDQAALYLADQRGALAAIDRGQLCDDSLARLAGEWASFPLHHGGSAYGQPVKAAGQLRRFFNEQLKRPTLRLADGQLV
ncbi:glycoside hydrolase family 104 protein [Synechococcus sp. J7-Johnson]|uniref:glycoside hydrolase family 24 protein n=1 Tax=Synechococcus sp. J7-Johnson TaxID=2823737 RepID=UPI0020CE5E5E|nr:glycoside hydrolase family 104 protein [Synechococcus sp. J7-Johnson]MCP9839573.1 glycoside hydrolase family 104 protein [Synechococcus sp. J7-Johnson]